jgi:hypothetical protein
MSKFQVHLLCIFLYKHFYSQGKMFRMCRIILYLIHFHFCVFGYEGCLNAAAFLVLHLEGPSTIFWNPCCSRDSLVSQLFCEISQAPFFPLVYECLGRRGWRGVKMRFNWASPFSGVLFLSTWKLKSKCDFSSLNTAMCCRFHLVLVLCLLFFSQRYLPPELEQKQSPYPWACTG